MKVRITAITAEGMGKQIAAGTTALEDLLIPALLETDYGSGVEAVTVFFVAVDPVPSENARYSNGLNKLGRYKDWKTGKTVKTLRIAILIDPEFVRSATEARLKVLLKDYLIRQLESPPYEFPSKFDRERFLGDVVLALSSL